MRARPAVGEDLELVRRDERGGGGPDRVGGTRSCDEFLRLEGAPHDVRLPPHLPEPRRGEGRPHPVVVDEGDPRPEGADVLVRAPARAARPRHGPRPRGGPRGTPRGFGRRRRRAIARRPRPATTARVAASTYSTPKRSASRSARPRRSGAPRFPTRGRKVRAAVRKLVAREVPAHGAVSKRGHPVRDAGVDEGLGADDAPGTAGAVHHHERVRIRGGIAHPVHELRTGTAYPAGMLMTRNSSIGRLSRTTRRSPRSIIAFSSSAGDRGSVAIVFDELPERLARHVDAGERGVAGRPPCRDPTRQHPHVRVAEGRELGAPRSASPSPSVAEDHRDAPPRHEPADPELEAAQGQAGGIEDVALAERSLLPEVEEGDRSSPSSRQAAGVALLHRRDVLDPEGSPRAVSGRPRRAPALRHASPWRRCGRWAAAVSARCQAFV